MTRNTLTNPYTYVHAYIYIHTQRQTEKKRKGSEREKERVNESESERERKTLYESICADATFTDAGVDRANRPHYARALKTFLVLYGTCMTRLFIRKPVLLMDKKKEKKMPQ